MKRFSGFLSFLTVFGLSIAAHGRPKARELVPAPADTTEASDKPKPEQHFKPTSAVGTVLGGEELFKQPIRCETDDKARRVLHAFDVPFKGDPLLADGWVSIEAVADKTGEYDKKHPGPETHEGNGFGGWSFIFRTTPAGLQVHHGVHEGRIDPGHAAHNATVQPAIALPLPIKAGDTGAVQGEVDWHYFRAVGLESVKYGDPAAPTTAKAAHLEVGLRGPSTKNELVYRDFWLVPGQGLVKVVDRADPSQGFTRTQCVSTTHDPAGTMSAADFEAASDKRSALFAAQRDLYSSFGGGSARLTIRAAQWLLKKAPDDLVAKKGLCWGQLHDGRTKESIVDCTALVEAAPADHEAWLLLALAQSFENVGAENAAAAKSLALKPTTLGHYLEAIHKVARNQISEAKDDVAAMLASPAVEKMTFGPFPERHVSFDRNAHPLVVASAIDALLKADDKDIAGAEASLKTAIDALNKEGMPSSSGETNASARTDWEVEANLVRFAKAMVAWRKGDVELARKEFRNQAPQAGQSWFVFALNAAQMFDSLDDPDRALLALAWVMDNNPNYSTAARLACKLDLKKKNYAGAKKDCATCVAKSALDPICKKGLQEASKAQP
jgi:hypothetical protein